MTLAAGLQWHFQPQYAIDLGYFSTRGTLDEGPMTLNRFRIGMALHASKPLPPR
jgi:long-subunit fatty acid transport protein